MARTKTPEALAHHEAAHAVVAHFQELKFKHVTIVPEKDSLGHMRHVSFPKWFDPSIESSARVRIRAERHITVSNAGQLAEARFMGRHPRWGMHGDDQKAVDMALHLCGGSVKTAEAYLKYCWCMSEELVDLHWGEIQALAAALLERKTIKYWDAVEIISPGTAALRQSMREMQARRKARA